MGLGPHSLGLRLTLAISFKALSSNTITLGVRTSAYEFWGYTVESITPLGQILAADGRGSYFSAWGSIKDENPRSSGLLCALLKG